jgi:uncharacterized membrane protein
MEIKNRPKIKIPTKPWQTFITVFSLLLLLGNLAYIIIEWPNLPEKIPGHFNAAGDVDRWGGKGELLLLPAIGLVLWLGSTVLEKYPHVYNYINLTEENAEKQYRYAVTLLSFQKMIISAFFVYISVQSIQIAGGQKTSLDTWSMPLFLFLVFGSIVFYLYKVLRLK